jgi:uncharacterized protein
VNAQNVQALCSHEAGHAAAALLLGLDVADVHVDSTGGVVAVTPSDHPKYARNLAITTIAGPLEDHGTRWPPPWPLTKVRGHEDEYALAEAVERAGLDEAGYKALIDDALYLTTTPEFERLAVAISCALERHGRLDRRGLRMLKALSEGKTVEHSLKAATVTHTDQGEFVAIAAAYTVDRQGDIIVPGAFANTIHRWQASGKRMPLHWNHQGDAHNIIGSIDPRSMRETGEGLEVAGRLDLHESDTAREAWRSMRNNSMSLSFGYVTTKSRKRSDGVQVLEELDLFEISIVPGPANADTRILAMKSMDDDEREVPSLEELRARERALDLDGSQEKIRREMRDLMINAMSHPNGNGKSLHERADKAAREHGPVQIASFDC